MYAECNFLGNSKGRVAALGPSFSANNFDDAWFIHEEVPDCLLTKAPEF